MPIAAPKPQSQEELPVRSRTVPLKGEDDVTVLELALRPATATGGPHGALVDEVRQARDRALDRLAAERSPDGSWAQPLDLYPFTGAMYVIMLRTTGLIEWPGALEEESRLVRHLLDQVSPDGGFRKFPGSPSSTAITRVVILSLRLAFGEIEAGHRPSSWFRRNEAIDGQLEQETRRSIERAERFLDGARTSLSFELDHVPLAALLTAHVEWSRAFPRVPLLEPRLWALVHRSPRLARIERRLNRMTRKSMPAIAILYRGVRQRRRRSRPNDERAMHELAQRLCGEQNENGGWFFNTIYTMLYVMALREAGHPVDHPNLARGYEYLRRMTFDDGDGGAFVNAVSGDLWDTSHAVCTYLRGPGNSAADEAIRPSVEFLLRWQGHSGGYAWGSGSPNNADNDSTAFALRSLALAARTAQGSTKLATERALRRGTAYLLAHQSGGGGFNIWDASPVRGRRGSYGVVYQKLFDMPSADVTGRVLEALAEVGLSTDHQQVRKGLRFLLRTQGTDGAWWCRWWAGYLAGTAYVLRAYGRLGIRHAGQLPAGDRLLAKSHAALERALQFVLAHQNPDGGWGETIRSDTDCRLAGVGDSTPLHTAHVLSALLGAGWPADAAAVRRGVQYLLNTEVPEGGWEDDQATFTIFAGSLYYPYPFMARVMPVDALTDYLQALGAEEPPTEPPRPWGERG